MTPNQQQEQDQQDLTSIPRNQKYVGIKKRIETVTKSLSISYFKDILIKLTRKNPENAKEICNYIIAEKTEINIKNSTAETRIKVLVWLSNFFEDNLLILALQKICQFLSY